MKWHSEKFVWSEKITSVKYDVLEKRLHFRGQLGAQWQRIRDDDFHKSSDCYWSEQWSVTSPDSREYDWFLLYVVCCDGMPCLEPVPNTRRSYIYLRMMARSVTFSRAKNTFSQSVSLVIDIVLIFYCNITG